MKWLKKVLWISFSILILVLSFGWILRSLEETPQGVLKAQVVRGDIRQLIRGVGSLEAENVDSIRAVVSGRLLKIYVQPGEKIRKGDPLFDVENQDIEKDYNLTKAKYRQGQLELKKMLLGPDEPAVFEAQGSLDKASRLVRELTENLQGKEELYEKGFVSRREVEELQNKLESARVEESIARQRFEDVSKPPPSEEIGLKKAELSKMRVELSHFRRQWTARKTRASFKALVIEILKKEGDILSAEDSVMTLVNSRKPFVIHGMVYESEIGKITEGQEVFVKISGTQKIVKAEVAEISLVAKSFGNARKFPIKILLRDKIEGPIRLGIGVDYEILVEEKRQILTLPVQFVSRQAQIAGVWVVQNGKKQFMPLKLGLSDDALVEIVGLEEGQEVVLPAPGSDRSIP